MVLMQKFDFNSLISSHCDVGSNRFILISPPKLRLRLLSIYPTQALFQKRMKVDTNPAGGRYSKHISIASDSFQIVFYFGEIPKYV